MTVRFIAHIERYHGLSTDTKPTGCPVSSEFRETDTGITKYYDDLLDTWYPKLVSLGNSTGDAISVQNPLPVNGDSVYLKDINQTSSDIYNFSGEITDLFDNVTSDIFDDTEDNPKQIVVALKRPIFNDSIKLCTSTGSFSNVKLILRDAAGNIVKTIDESTSDTQYTSRSYDFAVTAWCNVLIQFHTTNQINLNYLLIPKITQNPSQIDPYTAAFANIDHSHQEIHSGDMYSFFDVNDIANSATRDLLVITPNTTKWAHFTIIVDGEAEFDYAIYEGATTSANGTSVSVFNRNRNSSNTNTTLVYHTPTVSGTGTMIGRKHIGGGKALGGTSRGAEEWILKQNTKYLIRITNSTTSDNFMSVEGVFYEHTNL